MNAQKIKELLVSFKLYWNKPPQGRYMPFKEIASYSLGSMGGRIIVYCIANMIISVGNVLIGNTIGIDPLPLYVIYIISILASIPLTALRAKMIDNTRSMKGKYRPYILSMGIPTIILGCGFVWMPYERMSLLVKCVVVLAFNIGFQFFYQFYNDAYTSIINVLSPNTYERSDVISIKSVVENLSPSIIALIIPIAAKWITGENTIYDLKVYRFIYPPILIAGFLLSLLIYANTKEKIVQAKTHTLRIKFTDVLRMIAQNKYFWVISFASWIGFLESSFTNILGWLYNYQDACTAGQYSLIVTITGNASLWPFLFSPFLIRKFGKRKLLIFSNLCNIFCIAMMLPIVRLSGSRRIIWFLVLVYFVNQFFTSMSNVLNTGINGDIRDYQQYKTGIRTDGIFASVALIGSVVTLATSSVLPAIYERAGLNQTVAKSLGFDGSNVYDVLYNREYFISICSVLVIASVAGAFLNLVPYFFYDLTEIKQKGMVKVLKIRAMFDDYAQDMLTDEQLVEGVELIREAQECEHKEKAPVSKAGLKAARETGDKAKFKEAKEQYKKLLADNEAIETSRYVLLELHRFETEQGKADLETARAIIEAGPEKAVSAFTTTMREAKRMPKRTEEEKELRKNMIRLVRDVNAAKKCIAKFYKNGPVEFDSAALDALYEKDYELQLKLSELYKQIKEAKAKKDSAQTGRLSEEIRAVRAEHSDVQKRIKKGSEENSIYYRAAKPYLDAKRLVEQSENYTHLDEILSLYDEAAARISEKAAASV